MLDFSAYQPVLLFFCTLIFLCWGSFLNVLAYRLVRDTSIIFPRSHCPYCKHRLRWYDLIPVFSWLFLSGKCRYCHHKISRLYPFIEVLTVVLMNLLVLTVEPRYFAAYFIFFSALIVTIRSDIETMLISRFASIFLVPVGVMFSFFGYLPLSTFHSILGALFGYFSLYMMSWFFYVFTKKEGLGDGDMELLSCVGAFLGVYGAWITLIISSCLGSVFSILYILIYKKNRFHRIAFGPFIAIGAISYTLYAPQLMRLFFGLSNF